MLTEAEFKDKEVIILDKSQFVYIMIYGLTTWKIVTISKSSLHEVSEEYLYDEEAYEFYKERMESFGYKPFPIIME